MGQSDEVSEEVARRLLCEQFPELATLEIRPAFPGWDNTVYRLGGALSLRLPRRDVAAWFLANEIRWLPSLFEGMPLELPEIVVVGTPTDYFSRPWYVARWVDGEPSDRSPIRSPDAAAKLSDFLCAFHVVAPADAPTSELGADLSSLVEEFDRRLAEVSHRVDVELVKDLWSRGLSAARWDGPPRWVHGDLHPANLISRGGRLVGVVDFGTLSAGDPAVDLAAGWLTLPEGGARELMERYGADEPMMERARAWAAYAGLSMLAVGQAGERELPGGKITWGTAAERAFTLLAIES